MLGGGGGAGGVLTGAAAGPVRDCKMIADRNSRRSKGIAYVEFREPDSVPKALAMNGQRMTPPMPPAPLIIMMTQSEKNRQAELKEQALAMGAASMPMMNPTRVRVENLPFSLTSGELGQLFQPFADNGGTVVRDAKVLPDPSGAGSSGTGYVEFGLPTAATIAVEKMNGMGVGDRTIRVSMDMGSMGPSGGTMDGGLHSILDAETTDRGGIAMTAASRVGLMARLAAGRGDTTTVAAAAPTFPPPMAPPPAAAAPAPPAAAAPAAAPTTPFFLLQNMFDPATETESVHPPSAPPLCPSLMRLGRGRAHWDEDIRDDVLEECIAKAGPVLHIAVMKESRGDVFVRFVSESGATKARELMHGRVFDGRRIVAECIPPDVYYRVHPGAASATEPLPRPQ